MIKNSVILMACIATTALAWGVFQVFGQYTFLIMLGITLALLFSKVKPLKSGNKK